MPGLAQMERLLELNRLELKDMISAEIAQNPVLKETRNGGYYALRQTEASRRLFVVFTIRRKLIRVISARDMNRSEREIYERYEKDS